MGISKIEQPIIKIILKVTYALAFGIRRKDSDSNAEKKSDSDSEKRFTFG